MIPPDRTTKMVHRMLEGDGVQLEHPTMGLVDIFIESVKGPMVKLSIKAPRSAAISWIHMNPKREEVDPTPYCSWCESMTSKDCKCGPRAAND